MARIQFCNCDGRDSRLVLAAPGKGGYKVFRIAFIILLSLHSYLQTSYVLYSGLIVELVAHLLHINQSIKDDSGQRT